LTMHKECLGAFDGDGDDPAEAFAPGGHGLACVILANSGFITTDAAAWLASEHVAVFVAWKGEFLTLMNAPAGRLARGELKARKRQME
jgi:hypothetical protein